MTCQDLGKFECSLGTCINEDQVCDYSDDCLDLSDEKSNICTYFLFRCDFESGTCKDWEQDFSATAKWTLMQATDDNSGLLPNTDHTHGTTDGLKTVLF